MHRNYTLIDQRDLAHIDCVGYLYRHISGAQVLYLKSDDDNKVFSVAFKTPPDDETGVAHIMEHCVLNGSQKYPLKDPFNELANGSLYTFLNAMTYPDRTIYPIASVNDKDFVNLMDVYLDAVFFPKIYDRKETLLQEGWHYQLEDGQLKYNGIVYNEMKGAYSDPQGLLSDELHKALFPNSIYSLDSGGNPDYIPDLGYKKFVEFHKKYYHPENALIYFYGNMDIDFCFDKLDGEYLSKFATVGLKIEIAPQLPLPRPVFSTASYSVADEDGLTENYMAMSVVLPEDVPPRDITGMKLLYYILMATPASPLYKALVEAEAGEDINGYCSGDILHPVWRISMKNAAVAADKLKELIDDTLAHIVADGLDKNFVAACMNFVEFQAKEGDHGYYPKGLTYNERAMTKWVYDKSPFDGLMGITYLAEIRALYEAGGYLEGLIRRYLLENPHQAYVTMEPVLDLDGQKEQEAEEKLGLVLASMEQDEIDSIAADYGRLKEYQETPDSQEVLELIPRVAVADVKKDIEHVPLNVVTDGGINLLHAPLHTNDIIYTTMLFDMQAVPVQMLPLVKILQHLLSKVATKKYSTAALTEEIKANLGGLSFGSDVLSKTQQDFMPRATVSAKVLAKNAGKMFDIAAEIVGGTAFDDRGQIKNYVLELKAGMEDMFLTNGSLFAVERAASYFSPAAAYSDRMGGLYFYEYIKGLTEDFDNRFEELREDLARLARMIYTKANVLYSIVADDELYTGCSRYLRDFNDSLGTGGTACCAGLSLVAPKNEGFITASKVQYCAMAADIFADGHKYTGGLKVLSSVLDDFLYDEIRVKGGAYGMGSSFGQNGGMYLYSYRDPHVANTYQVFRRGAEYLRRLDLSRNEMEKFILGTIRSFDRPLTNANKGLQAASRHILGITDEMRAREREEILTADVAALRRLADVLEAAVAQDNICAVGSEAAINQAAGLFGSIVKYSQGGKA
ncbi:MAG: insulinase family protein [Defluviitaleaceae bacterium]|nr:insulinase family protein [Defluviitaleaceae bacterium]